MDASTAEDYLSIKCPNCGNPQVSYNEQLGKLHCDYCEYTQDLPGENDEIVERPLHAGMAMTDLPRGLNIEARVYHCQSCGSERSIASDTVGLTCPFCGSEAVNESATETRVIQPAGLIPFAIAKEEAYKKFRKWLGRGWFHPNNLSQLASLDKIMGIYLPFWTFDASTYSQWTAQAGYYYYETRYVTDANGNRRAQQVRKIRWQNVSGRFQHFFDDVLVVASHGVSQSLSEKIYPYDLTQLVNYDAHYLLGWETELYQHDLKDSYQTADRIMDDSIREMIIRQIPGDTFRFLKVRTQKDRLTYKHLLLPAWVAGYRYKGKVFQFLVNGQTGRIGGKKPLSAWKIAIAVILGLIVIGGIVLVAEYQNGNIQLPF
jgi:predicted RNA-binding Zn-ribbon protein involved in translation (DUF1610 family)